MGILSAIAGKILGGSIAKTATGIADAVDRFVETPDEKRAAALLVSKMKQDSNKWQAEVNKIEAAHRSMFVAGWRPAIGWICALCLLWGWIVGPLLQFLYPDKSMPAIEVGQSITLIMALLGMGTLRTFEKKSGVSG
jgi:hypothetical protein